MDMGRNGHNSSHKEHDGMVDVTSPNAVEDTVNKLVNLN